MGFKSNKVELKGVSTSKVDTPLTTKVELDEKELADIILVCLSFLADSKMGHERAHEAYDLDAFWCHRHISTQIIRRST